MGLTALGEVLTNSFQRKTNALVEIFNELSSGELNSYRNPTDEEVIKIAQTWLQDFKRAEQDLKDIVAVTKEDGIEKALIKYFHGFNEEFGNRICDFNYGTICGTILVGEDGKPYLNPMGNECYFDSSLRGIMHNLWNGHDVPSNLYMDDIDMVHLENSLKAYEDMIKAPRKCKNTLRNLINVLEKIQRYYDGNMPVAINGLGDRFYKLQNICIDDTDGVHDSQLLLEIDFEDETEIGDTFLTYSQNGHYERNDII